MIECPIVLSLSSLCCKTDKFDKLSNQESFQQSYTFLMKLGINFPIFVSTPALMQITHHPLNN